MAEAIKAALAKLDVANDNHWTQDGLPRIDTVRFLAGDQTLERAAISAAAPGFSRATAAQGVQGAAASVAAATPAPKVEPVQQPAAGLPKVEEPPLVPKATPDEIQALKDDVEATGSRLAEATKVLEEAQKAHIAATKANDAAILRLEAIRPQDTNTNAIQSYLAQQVANGQERARRIQAMKGIDLKAILPAKAPIDAAMSRKAGFGLNRPK